MVTKGERGEEENSNIHTTVYIQNRYLKRTYCVAQGTILSRLYFVMIYKGKESEKEYI